MKNSILLFIFILLISSCSKKGMTPAKVKLNIAGIVTLTNGIGNGGAILYGRSSTGEIFGHAINSSTDDMVLPNGDWTFYAFMWDSVSTPAMPMNDNVYCGKSVQKLSGLDLSITMNLANANCTDPEFSNGKTYVDGSGKNRFADVFLEECDDLNSSKGFTCGLSNQGSALSYRVVFKDFNKSSTSALSLGPTTLTSSCQKINRSATDILQKGLPINFPSGNGSAPFIVGVEMFLGNDVCNTADPKGVYSITLNQGFGTQNPTNDVMLVANNMCSFQSGSFTGTPDQIKTLCEDTFGTMNGGTCATTGIPATISRFAPAALCTAPSTFATGAVAIKHLVTIPKTFLCNPYLNQSTVIGAYPFAGGNGTSERPYKICTEWQLNQIGEYNTPVAYSNASYKLMNDLDMNNADFGPYAKPLCVGVVGSLVDRHHNLNPLDKISLDCVTAKASSSNSFQGTFDGNNKTISNARIEAKNVTDVGFVRAVFGNAVIKNLNFNFPEIRGTSNVGGVVGNSSGTIVEIKNITMDRAKIEAESSGMAGGNYVGAIVGANFLPGLNIANAQVTNSHVRGSDNVGGLVGQLQGSIALSSFRGSVEANSGAGVYSGGLVGSTSGSTTSISDSFTEGSISGSTQYMAGIAGMNTGAMNRVYSTMAVIQSITSMTAINIAGLIANSGTMSSLTDAFFDGTIKPVGTPTSIGGVVASGSGPATNCFSSLSGVAVGGGSCTTITPATLRDGARTTFVSTFFNQLAGSIPRFVWETRECLNPVNQQSLSAQVANQARGTQANPLVICNSTQLSSVSARSSSEFYRLAEDINIGDWTVASLINTFNGSLNGDGKILYGLNVSPADATAEAKGMIKTVAATGKITSTHFYGGYVVSTAATAATSAAVFSGENFGELRNIVIKGSSINGNGSIGLIAGYNNGIIADSAVFDSTISASTSAGSVAGVNDVSGQILRNDVRSSVKANSTPSSFSQFGGIVGYNKGLIDQNRFSGNMSFTTMVTTSINGLRAGGLVGYNQGTLSNSYVDNWANIATKDANKVGGLVGENDVGGSVNRSFNLGKVVYDNLAGLATGTFHPLVSAITAGAVASDSYYLENQIASLLGSIANSATPCAGLGATCTTSATYPTGADGFLNQNGGSGGQLSTLTPLTSTGTTTFTYLPPIQVAASQLLNFYKLFVPASVTQARSIANFGDINVFCPGGWSGTVGNETCASGYDIIGVDKATNIRYGENRMIDYYKSIMYKTPTPANAPVWDIDQDGNPSLMQLEHF